MSIAARSRRQRRGARRRRLYSALLALIAGAGWWFAGSGDLQPRFAAESEPVSVVVDTAAVADAVTSPAAVEPVTLDGAAMVDRVTGGPLGDSAGWVDLDAVDGPEPSSASGHRPATAVPAPGPGRTLVDGSAGLTRAPPRA
jgi:hypothetical protein